MSDATERSKLLRAAFAVEQIGGQEGRAGVEVWCDFARPSPAGARRAEFRFGSEQRARVTAIWRRNSGHLGNVR
jgi:hypothetical protein